MLLSLSGDELLSAVAVLGCTVVDERVESTCAHRFSVRPNMLLAKGDAPYSL